MIVKNEEALLSRCLDSVKGLDEIIIADTGSIDKTIEIAKKYTDKIYTEKKWEDDYAPCRNYAKSKATGDWILSIDADEILHDVSKVKEAVALAEQRGVKAVSVKLIAEDNGTVNDYPRLFKNLPEVFWVGNIHNHLSVLPESLGDVRITFGFSPAHNLDPNRTLRILEKEVNTRPNAVREMYYLGREYWYRRRYEDCVKMLGRYVQKAGFMDEKADGFLIMGRAYWAMKMGEDAREATLHALIINSNFSEAADFMATISGEGSGNAKWEANARRWREMAENGENNNVLFARDWKTK